MDFLVRTPNTTKTPTGNFYKTATSLFPLYDLPLFSNFDIYFHSLTKKLIKPEDVILHTLLLEPDNVRYSLYALLVLKKMEKQIDKTYLFKEAKQFELEKKYKTCWNSYTLTYNPKDNPFLRGMTFP